MYVSHRLRPERCSPWSLTLGLVGLGAVALRRFSARTPLARFSSSKKERRLAVVESLVLDPARRLVIVSCDGEERLLLLERRPDGLTAGR